MAVVNRDMTNDGANPDTFESEVQNKSSLAVISHVYGCLPGSLPGASLGVMAMFNIYGKAAHTENLRAQFLHLYKVNYIS